MACFLLTFVCRAVNARFIPSTFFVYKAEILCLRLAFSEKAALPLSLPPLSGGPRPRQKKQSSTGGKNDFGEGGKRTRSKKCLARCPNELRAASDLVHFLRKKNVKGIMGKKSAKLVGRVSRRYWSVGLTGRLADMRFRGLGTRAVVCRACFSE